MQDQVKGAKLPEVEVDQFELWLSERHKWLQTAAARMVRTRAIPDKDAIEALADLCLIEGSKKESPFFEVISAGSIDQAASSTPVRLLKISDVSGVNAIKHGATLAFSENGMSVIYGQNGSGKSGFSRLIKQICGSKAKEKLHANIFSKEHPEPSANVLIGAGEVKKEGPWKLSDGPIGALRHVHVFDSGVATMYFGLKNEATYEPSKMKFVSYLIKTCDDVATELNNRKSKLQSNLAKIPPDLTDTLAGRWLFGLKAGTTTGVIEEKCRYTEEMDQERITGEATLAEKDIPGRLKVVDRAIMSVGNVQKLLDSWKVELGNDKLSLLISARVDAQNKRKLATEDAEKVFAGVALEGVGQPAWQQLWEKAREFSVLHAYKEIDYPNTQDDAKCVLCQQTLNSDARDRLNRFESFIKGSLEKDAKEAERKLNNAVKDLPKLPSQEVWLASTGAIKLEEPEAVAWLEALSARISAAETATDRVRG